MLLKYVHVTVFRTMDSLFLFDTVISRGGIKKETLQVYKARYFVAFNLNICFIFICKSFFICPFILTPIQFYFFLLIHTHVLVDRKIYIYIL